MENLMTGIQTVDISNAARRHTLRRWSLPSSCSVILRGKLWTVTDAIFFIAD
jgi:hypothetical protein